MRSMQMSAKEATQFVRSLRPRSIETRTQEKCLDEFESTFKTWNIVNLNNVEERSKNTQPVDHTI